MDSNKKGSGIGFCGTLTLIFIVLKLVGVIAWHWVWVLSPIWVPILFVILVAIVALLIKWLEED